VARALAPWPASVRAQPKTLGQEGSFRRVQSAGQLRRQIVDAMIPGTRTAATEKGELALLVTVDPSLLDRLTPVFQAIGSRTRQRRRRGAITHKAFALWRFRENTVTGRRRSSPTELSERR
jgi:hypothetical protein